ncbi:unnamed protein product, partial [Pelagomonas calceolata]
MRVRLTLAVAMASSVTALVKPLATRAAVLAQVPKLVDLAAACGWDFYGPDEWTFLADAACDSGWVVEGDDGKLLGCLFRADYERANGLGMMLVSPAARGQGLGKKLMNAGLGAVPADRKACPVILGVATDMGRPMYEKMGYGVTNQITSLRVADASKLKGTMSADVEVDGCCASVDAIAAIDQTATGLDRKRALQTLLDKDGALSAIARDKASGEVVGAAISIVGRDGGRVIGPLLGSHEAALPLVHAVAPEGTATLKAIGAPADILVETLTSAGFEVAVECPSAATRCPENASSTSRSCTRRS